VLIVILRYKEEPVVAVSVFVIRIIRSIQEWQNAEPLNVTVPILMQVKCGGHSKFLCYLQILP